MKHIAELIEKANLEGMADVVDCESGEEGLGAQLLENFAELIVRECAAVVSGENTIAHKTIMQHFGLEKQKSTPWPKCEFCGNPTGGPTPCCKDDF